MVSVVYWQPTGELMTQASATWSCAEFIA